MIFFFLEKNAIGLPALISISSIVGNPPNFFIYYDNNIVFPCFIMFVVNVNFLENKHFDLILQKGFKIIQKF